MKKILLIATGGTIASSLSENGLIPTVRADELLSFVPGYKEICDVDCVQPFCIDSTNVTPEHWLKIVALIKEKYDLYDGFLVVHGTDTLSYTACALSCLIRNSKKPIVLTGSQRPVADIDTDAKKNLIDSLRFAVSGHQGTVVVFDGKVIDGMCAKKIKTLSDDAFVSVNRPEIRELNISDGETVFYDKLEPNIMTVKLTPGMPESIFDSAKKFRGIVIEGYGLGGIPEKYMDKIHQLSESGVVIAVTTQVLFEGSDLSVYEVGAHAKKIKNVVETGLMTSEAVTVKLMWALAQTGDINEIIKYFAEKQ